MLAILIADDHAIVRKGLRAVIMEEYPFARIDEASDAEELIKKTILGNWDLVICDLNMPGRTGLDALKQIKQSNPRLPVLIMSVCSEDQYAVRAMKAGASGYFCKTSIHEELIPAIAMVRLGKKFIPPPIAERLVEALAIKDEQTPHQLLSDREFDVFKLLVSGRTVSEIADMHSLSSNTVSTYRARILEKMNMHSNTELIRYALEKGLV